MDFSLGKSGNELVIDCSSSDLKLVVGNYNSKTGNISIDKMGIVPLEGDAVNDGAISDSFGIVMALKHAIARLDIRMKSCIITTEGAFVHTRDLELPVVKEDQLKDMVKYEILGQGSNRDMSIDYLVYGDEAENGRVPVLKTGDQWMTDLESVIGSKEVRDKLDDETRQLLDESGEEIHGLPGIGNAAKIITEGLCYDEYLVLMTLCMNGNTRLLRIMDIVQINMKYRYYRDFNLMEYHTGVRYALTADGNSYEFEDSYR